MLRRIEAAVIILFFVLPVMISVTSVCQTAPDFHDGIEMYIKNSKGNYWKPIGSNIQAAINDLDNISGTVWLPGCETFNIDSTIILWNNVILDMGGCVLKPFGNFDVIDMRESSTLKNGIIDVSDITDYSHACIVINGIHYIDHRENSTKIFNMELKSTGGQGTGIYLHAEDISDQQMVSWVRCNVIRTEKFEYGIHINNENTYVIPGKGAVINGNTFTDLRGYADKYFIYIERNTSIHAVYCATDGNYFNMIQYQTSKPYAPLTETVIRTDGYGNIFDNVMIWDWHNVGQDKTSIEFTSDTRQCYISFRGGCDVLVDNGLKNTILNTGTSDLKIRSFNTMPTYQMIQQLTIIFGYLKILGVVVLLAFVIIGVIVLIKRKRLFI